MNLANNSTEIQSSRDTSRHASKIGVIIRHEFMTRIRSKGFIIATLLAPVGLLAMILIPALAAIFSKDDSDKRIAIVDATPQKIISRSIAKEDTALFYTTDEQLSTLEAKVKDKSLTGYLYIPSNVMESDSVMLYSKGGGGISFYDAIDDAVTSVMKQERLRTAGADSSVMSALDRKTKLARIKLGEKGAEKDAGEMMAVVGYIMGFLIYMMMFIYGSMVMRAVLEEKTNRIVEVIASSARPFDIMMGKILGVGAIGLVQVVVWIALSTGISAVAVPLVKSLTGEKPVTAQQAMMSGMPSSEVKNMEATMKNDGGLPFTIPTISPWLIIGFVFYFLSGYFLYSALFAAIAAAADQEQDIQSLQMPVTLPLIIPMLFIGNIISAPDGTLATVLSMIPFFTPLLMIVRAAATTVPIWQLVVSSILLVVTFLAAVWSAGRVYRVGILNYGKKASFKDIAKWLVRG
jgi:ABC-2 type transport system permease protein